MSTELTPETSLCRVRDDVMISARDLLAPSQTAATLYPPHDSPALQPE